MKIGVISDTHDFLDPRVKELFAGVDHILHAGDIGTVWITFELEQIAPVTAVFGNTDAGLSFRETELVTLGEKKFLNSAELCAGLPTRFRPLFSRDFDPPQWFFRF